MSNNPNEPKRAPLEILKYAESHYANALNLWYQGKESEARVQIEEIKKSGKNMI